METLIIVALFIILSLAAMRWGVDSTDGIDSHEWEHRADSHGEFSL